MQELFTLSEAAAIAEISPDTLRTALEKKSVKPSRRQRVGRAVRHKFSEADILLAKVLVDFPFALSKQDKQSLAQVLVAGARRSACWSLRRAELVYQCGEMRLSINCKPLQQKIERNLAAYRAGQRRVVSKPGVLGGEPVFRGTRIPLQHVAALFRKGVAELEIRQDFPHLTSRDLNYARLASRFLEKPGRPKKALNFQKQTRAA